MPNKHNIKLLAEKLNVSTDNPIIEMKVLESLRDDGLKQGLQPVEIPKKIKLCSEEWTPENEMITAALKIKRNVVCDFYKNALDEMYSS